jgi:hypothetical protein
MHTLIANLLGLPHDAGCTRCRDDAFVPPDTARVLAQQVRPQELVKWPSQQYI